ncbi:MAG: hypothetical protein QHJ81_03770 [Anaerolineae bacterium]|nr:hypothetical protein [Anaerolineae bacterium]
MDDWIEEHLDILQNIEFAIVQADNQTDGLTDWEVEDALSELICRGNAFQRGRETEPRSLPPKAQAVADMVEDILAFRIEDLGAEDTLAEHLRALKTVRASVKRHRRIHGRRGYLDFIREHVR